MWTALQFDEAIQQFGIHVENKLHDLDNKGKPKHTLKQLLTDHPQVRLRGVLGGPKGFIGATRKIPSQKKIQEP